MRNPVEKTNRKKIESYWQSIFPNEVKDKRAISQQAIAELADPIMVRVWIAFVG